MHPISTKLKIALGYLLLTILLIAAIGYIYTGMRSLTQTETGKHIQHVLEETERIIGEAKK